MSDDNKRVIKTYTFKSDSMVNPQLLLAVDAFYRKFSQPIAQVKLLSNLQETMQKIAETPMAKQLNQINKLIKQNPMLAHSQTLELLTSFSRATSIYDDYHRFSEAYHTHLGSSPYYPSSVTSPFPVYEMEPFLLRIASYRLIQDMPEDEPEPKIILADDTARIKKAIRDIYRDNQHIYQLQPREFEELVAELLRKKNFEVELTKQTRDGGYDLIALRDVEGIPMRFLVECKRYAKARKVGIDIVRSFCEVINDQGQMGMIFTTSYFSPDAIKYRESKKPYQLHYRDHDDLIDWVNAYLKA